MRAPVVCLVVPNGSHRPEPLAVAIRQQHPDWDVTAVWAGDPQLVPVLDDAVLAWCAPADELVPAWEHVLVSLPTGSAEWSLGVAAARRLVGNGERSVVVLHVGSVAVTGPLASLVPSGDDVAVRVPRTLAPLPDDGAAPTTDELAAAGPSFTTVAAFAPSGGPLLDWLLGEHVDPGPDHEPGRRWQLAPDLFTIRTCTDPAIGVGRWRWDDGATALLDLESFDTERPWVLDAASGERARITVVDRPERAAALLAAAPQVHGRRDPLLLPGGVVVDPDIAALVRAAKEPPPRPWSDAGAFRSWLAGRYWTALHRRRRDLGVAFRDPVVADAGAFARWVRRACIDDGKPLVLGSAPAAVRLDVAARRRHDGLNVVGYLDRDLGLGDIARRIAGGLDDADVPVAPIVYHRTNSPRVVGALGPQRVEFTTTLAVVTADQFPFLRMDHPELFDATERMIGYWFWELEHIPRHMRASIDLVDEIWAGSQFVVDAFAAVARVPVRHVPIPVPEPVCSDRDRASFAPLADVGDRPVLGVVLDHFSVTARKNPIGAVTAFRRAFRPDEGPMLVVKTMNGEHRWPQHQELLAAAAGRPDIRVWDTHLSRVDHMAFIRSLDGLVSLHRSEGLGLHIAEAMWLGAPVIATRYSGNLDFMDDDCSVLIDAAMVHVEGGEGVYPAEAMWADPDLDQAAAAMRRLVEDGAWRAALAQAGRARMEAQPTMADTARRVAALVGARMAS